MADVFMQLDVITLLQNKHVFFMGDSNIRAQYKDLTWLLNYNTLINNKFLKTKLEKSYLGDKLTERSKLHYGRDFQESRLYVDRSNGATVEFMFLTRCFNHRLEKLFNDFKRKARDVPDVIVMNSCLWDLTRWGPNGVPEYKDNIVKLMRLMKRSLPKECLVIWVTSLPTAPHVRGGLIIKQIEFMEPLLRFEVMEANTFARGEVVSHGFDVLDNHYHTRMQMHRRAKDGIHYLPIPVRFMTNLLLTHIALSWGRNLPNNIHSVLLDKAIALETKHTEQTEFKMPPSGIFSKINLVSPVVSRTRGLTVTFSPQCGSRQCNLFENQLSATSSSVESATCSRIRSVVQLPPNNLKPHAAAGPYRNKKNKKKRKANRPYQQPFHQNTNTPSFYNPYPDDDSHFSGYYPNGEYSPEDGDYIEEYNHY